VPSVQRKGNNMSLIIAAIAIFALGFVTAALTDVPPLIIAAGAFALIVALVVVDKKRGKK